MSPESKERLFAALLVPYMVFFPLMVLGLLDYFKIIRETSLGGYAGFIFYAVLDIPMIVFYFYYNPKENDNPKDVPKKWKCCDMLVKPSDLAAHVKQYHFNKESPSDTR